WQPLREQRLDLDAQHAGGVLHRRERALVGDAQSLRVLGAQPLFLERRFDLQPRAVHQHQADLERGEHVDVVDEAREARALGDQLTAEGDDERAAAEVVHVRRDLTEPADEIFSHVIFSNCKCNRRGARLRYARRMKTLRALLIAAVLAAPFSAGAADDEDKSFRHILTLIQTFTSIAAQSNAPERDIADVLAGKNPQANAAASGLLQEITADMPPATRSQMSAIGADLLSI